MGQQTGNNSAGKYIAIVAISGATTGTAAYLSNAELIDANAVITSVTLFVDTAASGTCTFDVGLGDSATDNADARHDDFLVGIDGEVVGTYNNIALDIAGATGVSTPSEWPVDDFVLVTVATGSAAGLVGRLHVEYYIADPAA